MEPEQGEHPDVDVSKVGAIPAAQNPVPTPTALDVEKRLQPEVMPAQAVSNEQVVEKTSMVATVVAFVHTQKRVFQGGVVAALLVLAALGGTAWYSKHAHTPVKQYTKVYSFVPEKISTSAMIPLSLPEGVNSADAQKGISFSPDIKGSWQSEERVGLVVFHPAQPLALHTYYAVNLNADGVKMSDDFYVDEDPKIKSIFPTANTEASEDSKITFVFNRPMVALTTLSEQESKNIPISISPKTEGRFKWMSTRSLQFIPSSTLVPSSEYTVSVGSGLTSVDGLEVAPVTQKFTTRLLRYATMPEKTLGYRSPMIVSFNQPVDLNKTASRISVHKGDGTDVPVDVTYGETKHYDPSTKKTKTDEDKSKIFVYQKKDVHGRAHVWDFSTTYGLDVKGAVPQAGSVVLDEERTAFVTVPGIVESAQATSPRTTLVRPDLFDPQGTLVLTFYDDVDKDASRIDVQGLKSIAYGERCKKDEDGNEVLTSSGCEKESDTHVLILAFNESAFAVGESFTLTFNRIFSKDGFRINTDPIVTNMRVYQPLQILRTVPAEGEQNAALDNMHICTNAPIKNPGDAGVRSYIQTTGYIVFGRWSESRYVEQNQSTYAQSYSKCNPGEFETEISYGLLPLTSYAVALSLTDSFDQKATKSVTFKTGAAKEQYTRFHNMQLQYNVTKPDRTKFTYSVENLEYVDMQICKLSPEAFLRRIDAQEEATVPPHTNDCSEVKSARIELPHTYWVNNYFQVDLHTYFSDTRGQYVVTFSNPLYKANQWTGGTNQTAQLYDRTYVSVTNLAVGKKEVAYADPRYSWSNSTNPDTKKVLDATMAQTNNLYWVNYSASLTPASGASVTQFVKEDVKAIPNAQSVGVTDGQGIARVRTDRGLIGAVVKVGDDTAVVSNWADTLGYASPASDASRTYIYTDRPIYRPGHTVYIRGIDRVGFDGSYEVWQQHKVPLAMYDTSGKSMYTTELPISTYGTFNTQFELPKDTPLGTYRIEAYGQSAWFDVEEYVPAAFKVDATSDKEEYINGDTVKLDVQAAYYFGVPLSEGTVSYSVTAQDYYFDRYADEYFNFGGSWYTCYSCGYGDNFLFRGQTHIGADGSAHIERAIKLSDYFKDATSVGSKLITVSLTAKDINGRSVSTQKSFIMHKGEFYIGATTDTYYTSKNTPVKLRAKTVDNAGKPIALSGITRTVNKIDWDTFKRQEVDGGFYYRSEKRTKEISKETILTDKDGNWQGDVTFAGEGEYEIVLSKVDGRGNKVDTTSSIYIYGEQAVAVPPNNNYALDLVVERPKVKVGDKASVLIKSPYDHAKVLITAERGTIYDYWVADVTGGLYLHTFPIKAGYAPDVYISALLLSQDPEVKYGSTRFEVARDEHLLNVKVTSDKESYLPGEKVTLTVATKDSAGKPVPAEVSLAVADLSVLALKGNPKRDPLTFFYDGFPLSVSTASNIKNIFHEIDIPLGTKGGGGNPDDPTKKKRGLFKDTAYWNASVETDAGGTATISFTLPDNLTTWQIESIGVTKDTKVGIDYKNFTTKKNLMAVPLKPRFVIPGDTFMLGAQVFNQTDADADVQVKLESTSLTLSDGAAKTISIKKGETKTVYFPVTAPLGVRSGQHTFTFTASFGTFVDAVEQSIPITPNTSYETVATSHMTSDAHSSEYVYIPPEVENGEGGLTIHANATMAVFMIDALTYMAAYPYGCSEQLASSLSTIGTLTKALTVPNVVGNFATITYDGATYQVDDVVKTGLGKVYQNQGTTGGFSYYANMQPSLTLTMHVLTALNNLKTAGFAVDQDVLTRAAAYIATNAASEYRRDPISNKELVIWAEYVLRATNGNQTTELTSLVAGLMTDTAFMNETISSMSLAYLAIMNPSDERAYGNLKNRMSFDGRGAYLKLSGTPNWEYYETPIKDTALMLKVIVAHKDDTETIQNVLAWLLASKDADGAWGSTNNTFTVVDAMIDYLKWKHETEASFNLTAALDGVSLFQHAFTAKNIFETVTHFLPIDSIPRKKVVPLTFNREDTNGKQNTLYYDMSLKYFVPTDSLPPRDEGITITRDLFALEDTASAAPITTAKVGDIVRGKITLVIPDTYKHIAVADMIPAGFEIVNFNLDTESKSLTEAQKLSVVPTTKTESGGFLAHLGDEAASLFRSAQVAQVYNAYTSTPGESSLRPMKLEPSHVESHDDRVFLYVDSLAPGVYEYEYYLRALVPGSFKHLPARAEELYFPEIFGRTTGDTITVTEK